MKIIFEKDDEQYIESLRQAKESGNIHPLALLCDEEESSVVFKVIDSVKANVFFLEFMRTDAAGRKKIEDAIGIRVIKSYENSEIKLAQIRNLIMEFETKAEEILK